MIQIHVQLSCPQYVLNTFVLLQNSYGRSL